MSFILTLFSYRGGIIHRISDNKELPFLLNNNYLNKLTFAFSSI